MPFQPRQYGLVDVPQIDPMRGLADLMQIGRVMSAYQEEAKERGARTRLEKALNDAKGDPVAAAGLLEKSGDFIQGRALRDNATKIRQDTVSGMLDRITAAGSIYGQGAQFLKEVQQRPELYGEVRPKLVDLATKLDPRLAAEIPEAYDQEKVTGMLQFVEGGAMDLETRARALTTAKAALDLTTDNAKREVEMTRSLGDFLSTVRSAEEWDGVKEHARTVLGFPSSVVDRFGGWDEKAPAKARELAMSPAERATDARAAVDDKRQDAAARETRRHNQAMEGIARQREARQARQTTEGLTAAGRAAAERWKAEQLDNLESELADPAGSGATLESVRRRQLQIENSYRAQLGLTPLRALPKEWFAEGETPAGRTGAAWEPPPSHRTPVSDETPSAPTPSAPVAQAPPRAAEPAPLPSTTSVGDTVVQDGQRYRVSKIDGQQASLEPVTSAPKKDDIVIYNGQRYRVADIKDGNASLEPVE